MSTRTTRHHRRIRPALARALALATPLLAACPLPVARTEALSAPVIGHVAWADGRPLRDAEVIVAEMNEERCGRVEVGARTNAAGRFMLESVQRHHDVTWFIPNLDRIAPAYRVCVAVDDTLRPAYVGRGALHESARADTVSCIVWEWEARPRVSCAGGATRDVVTGGRWRDGLGTGGAGSYRLFLHEERVRLKRYDKDKPQLAPHAWVQWLEPLADTLGADGERYRVRATARLPFDPNKVWAIRELKLWQRDGRWMASLFGWQHAFMNDMAEAELVYELGAPGQVTLVAGP